MLLDSDDDDALICENPELKRLITNKVQKWCESHKPAPKEDVKDYVDRISHLFAAGGRARQSRQQETTILTPQIKQARTAARMYYHTMLSNMPKKPHKILSEVDGTSASLGTHYWVSYHEPGYKCLPDKKMSEDEVQLWPQLLQDYKAVRKARYPHP